MQLRAEELHWAKPVREQQRVTDRTDIPRDRKFFGKLEVGLEKAKAERKAKSVQSKQPRLTTG